MATHFNKMINHIYKFLFNPLFLLFTDAKSYIDSFKFPDPRPDVKFDFLDPDKRKMFARRGMSQESEIKTLESDKNLRAYLAEVFDAFLPKDEYALADKNNPIALITYVLSVYLATDFGMREKFYASNIGNIPAITQFMLNNLRLGQLSNGNVVARLLSLEEYFDTLGVIALSETLFDFDYMKDLGFCYVLLWFNILNSHLKVKIRITLSLLILIVFLLFPVNPIICVS